MDWFRTHPYASALAGAGLVLVVGAFVVASRSAVTPSDTQLTTWGGTSGVNGYLNAGPKASSQPSAQKSAGIDFPYVSPFGTAGASSQTGEDPFDFEGFMAELARFSSYAETSRPEQATLDAAYAFMPTGLFSHETPQKDKTPLQRSLYDAGNDLGSLILGFESAHQNQAAILKNHAEDRNDPGKIAALKKLAADLSGVGDLISARSGLPAQVSGPAQTLAKSYREIGAKLALVADAKNDADFVDRALAYDATADTFAKNYVALALIFPAYGVSFGAEEPGSVFMMQQGSTQ